jgi:hypothetical protein
LDETDSVILEQIPRKKGTEGAGKDIFEKWQAEDKIYSRERTLELYGQLVGGLSLFLLWRNQVNVSWNHEPQCISFIECGLHEADGDVHCARVKKASQAGDDDTSVSFGTVLSRSNVWNVANKQLSTSIVCRQSR